MQEKKDFLDQTTKQGRFYRNLIKIGILLAGMLIAGGCYLHMQKKEDSQLVFEMREDEAANWQEETGFSDEEQESVLSEANEKNGRGNTEEEETKKMFFVHVCGQVKNPGVYQVEEGARICDAVQLAGGLTQEACEEAVNLAKKVIDGEQIRIPDDAEAETVSFFMEESQTESGQVDLNHATKEQLMTLTGIGEARAKDIIAYREEYGGFQTIEDIMKVPGIKEAAFAKIKDEIAVR